MAPFWSCREPSLFKNFLQVNWQLCKAKHDCSVKKGFHNWDATPKKRSYSFRNAFTGFLNAAYIAWNIMVTSATSSASIPAITTTSALNPIR